MHSKKLLVGRAPHLHMHVTQPCLYSVIKRKEREDLQVMIVTMATSGINRKAIADRLGMTEGQIKREIGLLMNKHNAADMVHLVAILFRKNIIT